MEITPKDTVNIEAYVNQVQDKDKDKVDAASEQPEQQQTKADTVEISKAAKNIQEAQNQLAATPEVREDKVAELKEQIENGTYEIDEQKIADKMMKDELAYALLNDLA